MIFFKKTTSSNTISQSNSETLENKYTNEINIYDELPVAYQSVDIDGNIIYVNQLWLDTLGYSSKEVIGKSFGNFIPKSNLELFKQNFPKFKKEGKTSVDFEMVKKDGSIIFVSFIGRIIYDKNGKFKQTHCVFKDITIQKKIEKQIIEDEKRLKSIIDVAPFGAHTYELKADGRLIFIAYNKSADKILNLDHKTMIGKELLEAFPGNAGTKLPSMYKKAALTGEPYYNQQVNYDAKGITGAFDVYAFQTAQNQVTVFFQNITEKIKDIDTIKKKSEELEQFNKFMIDREHKMIELKKQIRELEEKLARK